MFWLSTQSLKTRLITAKSKREERETLNKAKTVVVVGWI